MIVRSSVIRFDSKRGYLVAVICLALMVVALGAAAKHSQFESPLHSTHYLKQSVKMVACSDGPAVESPMERSEPVLAVLSPAPIFPQPAPLLIASPVPSPLLV